MFGIVAGIVTTVVTAITNGLNSYWQNKKQEAEHKIQQLQIAQQLKSQEIVEESKVNQERLRSTGRWFKYFTFFMWFGPFMSAFVLPEYGITVFKALEQQPDWYVQSCTMIMFAVWGISVSRETVSNVMGNLGHFLKQRRLQKNVRKLFFDAVRSNAGPMSQEEVNALNIALDKIGVDNEDS